MTEREFTLVLEEIRDVIKQLLSEFEKAGYVGKR